MDFERLFDDFRGFPCISEASSGPLREFEALERGLASRSTARGIVEVLMTALSSFAHDPELQETPLTKAYEGYFLPFQPVFGLIFIDSHGGRRR